MGLIIPREDSEEIAKSIRDLSRREVQGTPRIILPISVLRERVAPAPETPFSV